MVAKRTKGRQKIEMKRIENEDDRQITFSKRRSGIYNKASELVTLCGVEVGMVVFSPSGKPFSYAHPSINSIANRFINHNQPSTDHTHPFVEAHRRNRINELNMKYNELLNQLETEKQKAIELQNITKAKADHGWWKAPIDELNMEEVQQMNASLEELHKKLCNKMDEKSVGASPSSLPQIYPAQEANPFATSGNQTDPFFVHPNHAYGCGQL